MKAIFTEGSIFKHIVTMTAASTAGLLSLFLVDLVDMYWLSLLGDIELTAAVGFAASILFFTLSLSIGLSIGCAALVSQGLGRNDVENTKNLVVHIFIFIIFLSSVIAALTLVCTPVFLKALGAGERSHQFAWQYLSIVLPSMPLLGIAMAGNGVTRAAGKAKAAMWITLVGGIVNAALDPLFIFYFEMGIRGAAWATVISRAAMVGYAAYLLFKKFNLIGKWNRSKFKEDIHHYIKIAFPAMLTNLSTPIGVAYITAVLANFGDSVIAGNTIVSKLQPLAFAGLFALSGAIGPISGQNFGANKFDRVRETLTKSMLYILAYSLIACGILYLCTDYIIIAFKAEGDAALLIQWFCFGISTMFIFNGMTFVTNAMFNNLNAATLATTFNFSKATIGTIPFAYFGAKLYGPLGVYVGTYIGAVLIALIGLIFAYWHINRLEQKASVSSQL